MSFAKEVWGKLSAIDVREHTQKKMNLSFLSWSWAWATLMEEYPESHYLIEDSVTAPDGTVEVWVTLTVTDSESELTRRMWLPVMDHKNNSIQSPTTRQISDARMRCLVKCMAMFGLGHYIYAGEDMPSKEKDEAESKSVLDQINSAMERSQLVALWGNMTDTEHKAHESEFKTRMTQIEAEK